MSRPARATRGAARGAAEPAPIPVAAPDAEELQESDGDECNSVVFSEAESAASGAESEAAREAEPQPAAAGRGGGRGPKPAAKPAASKPAAARGGGGKGGRGKGGKGGGAAAAAPPGDAPAAGKKYTWVNMEDHAFSPRVAYTGEEQPALDARFDHLDETSEAFKWFIVVDATEEEYKARALNSEKYRAYRYLHDLDGAGKRCYDGAREIEYADMRYLDASLLLGGLDPSVSRHMMFERERLATKGHRVADLMNEDRLSMLRKFHHPANPATRKSKGQPGYDNLYQARRRSRCHSQESTASQSRAGRTKLLCLDCYDPNNARNMFFHADCWNKWHGICGECGV